MGEIMEEKNTCKICEKEIKKGRTYCSISCRNRDSEYIEKMRNKIIAISKKYDYKKIIEKRKKHVY